MALVRHAEGNIPFSAVLAICVADERLCLDSLDTYACSHVHPHGQPGARLVRQPVSALQLEHARPMPPLRRSWEQQLALHTACISISVHMSILSHLPMF